MTITKGSDVDVFDGVEQLVFERCRDIFELAPLSSVFCVTLDDGPCVGGTGAGRDGWVLPRIGGFDESSWRDGGVGCRRKNQTKVAMVSATECCRNGSGVGFELVFESLECCVGRFTNDGVTCVGKAFVKSSTLGMEEVIGVVFGRSKWFVVGRDGFALAGTLSPGVIVGLLDCGVVRRDVDSPTN